MQMIDRWVHLLTGLSTVLFAFFAAWKWPDLIKDQPTTFSTISGFLTLYGLLFAIIELYRAGSAAQLANQAVNDTKAQMALFYGLQDTAECQSCIDFALLSLDETGVIPSTTLFRIIKLYSMQFPDQAKDNKSQERKNIVMLKSYLSISKELRHASPIKVQQALVTMTSDLAAKTSKQIGTGSLQ